MNLPLSSVISFSVFCIYLAIRLAAPIEYARRSGFRLEAAFFYLTCFGTDVTPEQQNV